MVTLQEQFEKDFPNKGVREINAYKKYQDSNFTNYDLDLREYVVLRRLDLRDNGLVSVNLSSNRELKWVSLEQNRLISLKLPLGGWKERIWNGIKNGTDPQTPGLGNFIDTSDLDNWVENYDESKVGDIEYHNFCGRKVFFDKLDFITLDNIGNKVIARKLIVLSRLLTSTQDLPKNKDYEERMNETAEGYQMCGIMILPNKTPNNPWTQTEQKEVVNKALSGDTELLKKIIDLPYVALWVKKIVELQTQLTTAQEQIKKIPELEKELSTWKTKYEKVINFLKEIQKDLE